MRRCLWQSKIWVQCSICKTWTKSLSYSKKTIGMNLLRRRPSMPNSRVKLLEVRVGCKGIWVLILCKQMATFRKNLTMTWSMVEGELSNSQIRWCNQRNAWACSVLCSRLIKCKWIMHKLRHQWAVGEEVWARGAVIVCFRVHHQLLFLHMKISLIVSKIS